MCRTYDRDSNGGVLEELERHVPGWLILDPDHVPAVWQDRARQMALVPLLPDEAKQILEEGSTEPGVAAHDPEFLRLVARGESAGIIARRLALSTRSVHRRLARLRDSLRVSSTAELAAELSRRGF